MTFMLSSNKLTLVTFTHKFNKTRKEAESEWNSKYINDTKCKGKIFTLFN